jgi:hypothetical protein
MKVWAMPVGQAVMATMRWIGLAAPAPTIAGAGAA